MALNKINFTKKTLEELTAKHDGKRAYYYDIKIRGLAIAITRTGNKSFVVYRKIEGKPERITLGNFPNLSIENARKMAEEVNSQIAQGKNPNKAKKQIHLEFTIKSLFTEYIDRYAKNHKKSWQGDKNLYDYYLKELENKKISIIKKSEIEIFHAKIGEGIGKYAANRAIDLLRSMFNKAIDWGYEGANPCIGIKKFKEKSRERFLHAEELPKFFKALNDESNEVLRDFFYISLLTGARKTNVLTMNWDQISFERNVWQIEETKNGEMQNVHLSEEAIKILQKRYNSKVNEWVFPSSSSKSGHLEEPKSAWKRLLKRAELQDLRIHDLRRTLGSWQAATGANSYIIGKSLGHKTQAATAIYARLNLDPVRESVNKATSAMFALMNVDKNP